MWEVVVSVLQLTTETHVSSYKRQNLAFPLNRWTDFVSSSTNVLSFTRDKSHLWEEMSALNEEIQLFFI